MTEIALHWWRILRPAPEVGRLLPFALACALIAPVASSEEDTLESFGETLDILVVEVEAVVVDADGQRVPGLAREDFRLLVDGREVPIDYFSEVRDGRLAGSSGTGPVSSPDDPVPGDAVPTNYLVFIDEYFSIGARRDFVVGKVAERVRDLPPQDRMAVVAFDGEELEVLAGWDTPRSELEAVLAAAVERPTYGLLRSAEWVRRRHAAPWHDAVAQRRELEQVLTAVRSTLRMMPRPDGRKALLLLGGAWAVQSSYFLLPSRDPAFRQLSEGVRHDFEQAALGRLGGLIDTANLLGYTVYPVDVNGLRDPGGLRESGETPFGQELFRQGALRELGTDTGGRALLFADRERPLEAVVEDTRSYYSIGFTPELTRDGSRHEIRVEVRRPGLEVRARTGFRDVTRGSELDLLAESALRFGDGSEPGGGEALLAVELGEPENRPRQTMVVPLRVDVPWREITLLPSQEGLEGRLEIRVAARDREGSMSPVNRVPVELSREAEPDSGGSFQWESEVTLRRERHDLVVSVYDTLSGRVLTRRVSVEP